MNKISLYFIVIIMLFRTVIEAQDFGDSMSLAYNESQLLSIQIIERPDIPDGFEGLLAYGGGWIHLVDLKSKREIIYSGLPLMYNPSISPDGSMIAFGTDHIFLLDVNTGMVRRISPELIDDGADSHSGRDPHFSPDGRYIIYSTNVNRRDFANHPRLYDVQGSLPLTFNIGLPLETDIWESRWSPNGEEIVFFAEDGFRQPDDIYLVSADCINNPPCHPRLLRDNLNLPRSLLWSPDGQRISYVDLAPATSESDRSFFSLYTIELETQELEATLLANFDINFPTWSPDGRYLAFSLVNRDETSYTEGIYIVPAGGSLEDRILLVPSSGSRNMVWVNAELDFSKIQPSE